MAKVNENEVPATPARKPTPKKTFSLDNFKKKAGIEDVPDKELQWIKLSDAVKKATGLPGFAKGYVNLVRGHTNTGKSTAITEAIISCQKMGIVPIIIDTENNLGDYRLKELGYDPKKAVEIDNDYLLENFGKKQNKDITEASIEDLAKCFYYFLDMQKTDELDADLAFIVDSIGTLNCVKTILAAEKNDSNNNMWNAGAYEKAFMYLLNNTIPNSRKENRKHTNTIIAVQKIWIDNMNKGVVKHKGGETFNLGARLIFHLGGIITHGTQKITATSKKREVNYGMETKINVAKNHIDGPLGGISMEGRIISTPLGFVYPDDLDEFKKKNVLYLRSIFETDDINPDDVELKTKPIDGSLIDDLIERAPSTEENKEE
jgi:hypothetical protein